MKNIIIDLNIHSTSNTITNSSTTVFMFNDKVDKIKQCKKILVNIVKETGEWEDPEYDDFFSEPVIIGEDNVIDVSIPGCNFDWDMSKEEITEKYGKELYGKILVSVNECSGLDVDFVYDSLKDLGVFQDWDRF